MISAASLQMNVTDFVVSGNRSLYMQQPHVFHAGTSSDMAPLIKTDQ